MNKVFALLVVGLTAAAFAAPTVSDVAVSQNAVSRIVTVTYSVDEAAIVTFAARKGGELIAGDLGGIWGDISVKVASGAHSFNWMPRTDLVDVTVELTAWSPSVPPDYMVVDLGLTAAAEPHYYVSADDLPGGGLFSNLVYRTEKLVMRRIPAKDVTWRMGSPANEPHDGANKDDLASRETPHLVTLKSDYWMSVFEVTRRQYQLASGGGDSAGDTRYYGHPLAGPFIGTSGHYNTLRGQVYTSSADLHDVTSGSFLGKLRAATGIDFDLPTDAQWEFACRGGVADASYAGGNPSNYNSPVLKGVAWHGGAHYGNQQDYAGYTGSAKGDQLGDSRLIEVGNVKPNSFGLYDMLGNAWEPCLDFWTESLGTASVEDPVAMDESESSVWRGGCGILSWGYCRAASRVEANRTSNRYAPGLRLAAPIE